MSWYVLQCRAGREAEMVNSLNQHLSREALEEAFYFQSERLWRSEGSWKRQKKELFQGLAMEQLEKEWTAYPVLHLDLNARRYENEASLLCYT